MKRAAVRFVAGVLAASGALAALLAWRLARGPIDMPLLTSYLARALSSEGGPTVRVRATEQRDYCLLDRVDWRRCVDPVPGGESVKVFAVTVEPAGGTPAPTGPMILASK